MRMLENRVLREILRPKTDRVTEDYMRLQKSSFRICTIHQLFFERLNEEK
jgi:hypothetical protein